MFTVMAQCGHDAPGNKRRAVFEKPDEVACNLENFKGNLRCVFPVGEQKKRHGDVAGAQGFRHMTGGPVRQGVIHIPVQQQRLDHRIGNQQHFRVKGGLRRQHGHAAFLKLLPELAHQAARCAVIGAFAVREQNLHAQLARVLVGRKYHEKTPWFYGTI